MAADYDEFIVRGVQHVCKDELYVRNFDFYKDDPCKIIDEFDIDTVIMIGSACSMDDRTYLKFLRKLKKSRVRNIVSFEAGIQKEWLRAAYPFGVVVKTLLLYIFKREAYKEKLKYMENRVSYHAFNRTLSELKHIYQKSGFQYERIGPTRNKGYHTYIYSFLLR